MHLNQNIKELLSKFILSYLLTLAKFQMFKLENFDGLCELCWHQEMTSRQQVRWNDISLFDIFIFYFFGIHGFYKRTIKLSLIEYEFD